MMPPRSLLQSLIVVPLLAVVLAACGGGTAASTSAGTGSVSDRSASQNLDFSADTVGGDAFEGASLSGKPAVLWFWAPWCSTCRGQIGGVSSLVEKYGDRVNVVGVGSLDKAPAIAGFAADVPADMPHLLDPDGTVWRHFGVVEQSTYVVLDADSEVVSEGYLSDAELADMVSDLAG